MNFFVKAATITTTAESNYQLVSDFWLFVVYCLVVIVVVIFFSFYFNRVVGQLLTLLINQYTWRKYNVYIEVDAIRVSLLGGRVLFKNLRCFSTNQSISILKGHITVKYWQFHVRSSNDENSDKASKLPCRIICSVEGLELFFYNNETAYNRMKDMFGLSSQEAEEIREKLDHTCSTIDTESQMNVENSLLQRILPIQFECITGSVMIGNTSIKSMIVCKADRASGTYSVTKSRSSLDHYKSVIDLELKRTQFHLKENMDYKIANEHSTNTAAPFKEITLLDLLLKPLRNIYPFRRSRQYGEMRHMHNLMGERKRKRRSQGSYESDNTTYHEEYARVFNVLECSALSLSYYADYAGSVPSSEESTQYVGIGIDIGNGGLPPEWGVRISAWGTVVHYGPWTDLQRTELQDYFFPNSHRKNVPTKKLVPGQQRVATTFEIYIEFMNECCLRIPTHEKSKDWRYTSGTADLDIGSDGYYIRPYGWLNIKANQGSFMKMTMPYVCDSQGYTNVVDIVLKEVDVTTSVNYASFIQLNKIDIHVDMPSPLEWNGARQWEFVINARKPILFLLRDHIYLLQDLLQHWNSAPSPGLLYFTPMTYQLKSKLDDPIIYLCVNEHNIIRYPNSIEDNAYFKLQSQKLLFDATFPFTEYEPKTSSIKFSVAATNTSAGLSLQTSHTFRTFMRDEDAYTAVAVYMTLDGTYDYYSKPDILRHIESCNMNVKMNGATVKLFGTLIRYLFILRDNYFGEWNHFLTIDEYRKQRSNPQEWIEQKKKQATSKPLSDPFEVYVLFELEDGVMLFPENLYECSNYSQFKFQQLQVEVRNLDVYLDMYVNFSPITLSRNAVPTPQPKKGFPRIKSECDSKNYIYIDGLNVYAHRLFGPLPECATYLCHWELDVGRITGEIKPSFLLGLASFGQSFAYNLIDEDNAVPQEMKSKELPDVSFVKLHVEEIDICLMSMNSATNFGLKDGMLLEFDNLINSKYSQRITIKIPTISTRFLANPDQAHSEGLIENNEYPWVEVAKAELGVNVTVFRHTGLWKKARSEQQNFIRTQDYPTRRCVRLYEEADIGSRSSFFSNRSSNDHHVGIVYAPPFRPFMFGRVEDKSVLHDTGSAEAYTPISEHSSFINYFDSSEDSSSNLPSSTSESIYGHYKFYNDSYSEYSAQSDVSEYNESFHTADSDDTSDSVYFEYYSSSSEDDSYETNEEVSTQEDIESVEESLSKMPKTAIPPSIPYGSYLRRYKIKRPYTFHDEEVFFLPYLPPAHPQFVPEKVYEDKAQQIDDDINEEDNVQNEDNSSTHSETEDDNILSNGNEVIATIVIQATRPVTFLVTPIIIKVVQELTEEIVKDDWDLESMLDALQMKYIEQLTRYLTNQFICTRFSVLLPHVYLRCIQNVIIPDGLPSYKYGESFIKTQYNFEDNALCSGDIFLENFSMNGSVKFEDCAYQEKMDKVAESNLKLQELRLHIDVDDVGSTVQYVSKQQDAKSCCSFGIPYAGLRNKRFYSELDGDEALTNELIVLDFALSGFEFKLLGAGRPNFTELHIKSIDSVIIAESVEILVGAVYSWLMFVEDLRGILQSFEDRRSRQIQVFINEIANFSNTQGVVSDPIFLTSPSTMLRLGSRNFRNDCGWKLLAHMRHCLRLMPPPNRKKLQHRLTSGETFLNYLKSNEMFNNIVETFSHWRSWEVGYDDVVHCRLFTQPFEKSSFQQGKETHNDLTDTVIKALTTSSNFAKIRFETFKFTVFEEETTSLYKVENSISVGPMEFSLECLVKKSYISPPFNEIFPPDGGHPEASLTDKYLDIVTRVNFGKIRVSINPIIMAFARHMILVQRVFTKKMRSLQNATEIFKATTDNSKRESPFLSSRGPDSQAFSLDTFLSKIDVVSQALLNVDEIQVAVHSEDLQMDAKVAGIRGSLLFSNPKLSPLQLSTNKDHDSDTNSAKRSSNRGRKGCTPSDSRLVLESVCIMKSINIQFSEEVALGSSMLLEILLDNTNVNANLLQVVVRPTKKHSVPESHRNTVNVFLGIHRFGIRVPQSLLRLYSFIESWQSQQKSRFQFLFQNLVKEWEEQRKESIALSRPASFAFDQSPQNKSSITDVDINLQVLMNDFFIQADLLSSLSVEYKVLNVFTMANKTHCNGEKIYNYVFQLSKQSIHLITQETKRTALIKMDNNFIIPGIRSKGSLTSETINDTVVTSMKSVISIDVISMSLDASLIDSLLTAQSLLGSEISELVEVISHSKIRKKSTTSLSKGPSPSIPSNRELNYAVDISLDGVCVSVSSPTVVGMFRSNTLEASISNTTVNGNHPLLDSLTWKLHADNFSLSLDHNTSETCHLTDEDYHRNCLAYILVSFSIQNHLPLCRDEGCAKNTHVHETDNIVGESICIDFSKVHTVMQPIALGKLAEISIYYDTELRKKKQMKKDEIDQLSANTKRIVQTISSRNNWSKVLHEDSGSLLEGRIVNLHMRRVGIAIPLDLQSDFSMSNTNKDVSALLLSVRSIEFLTNNINKNALRLDHTAAQFVKNFDQSKADHFDAEKHTQMNQIIFPLITCHVSAKTEKPLQTVVADAHIHGFDLDIDGNIADYINTLSKIYTKCKDRVDSFTINTTDAKRDLLTPDTATDFEMIELNLEFKLMCESGTIRMCPRKSTPIGSKRRKQQQTRTSEGSSSTVMVEIPGLSAWVTYQTPLGAHSASADSRKRFHGDFLIFKSANTIHPVVVDFLREVVCDLKIGIQQSSEQKASRSPEAVVESNMDMSVFLRLSKARLDLTCQPVSKITCSIGWEASEFLISSFSAASRRSAVSCVGSLRKMTCVVKHHFSPEHCLYALIDRIQFTTILSSQRQDDELNDDISLLVEIPSLVGDLNIRHLQDLLILKSCWLKQRSGIPVETQIQSTSNTPKHRRSPIGSKRASASSLPIIITETDHPAPPKTPTPFSKHIAVSIKEMQFSVDLSQHIGTITLIPTSLLLQMHHIPFVTKDVSLTLHGIRIQSEGRLSGDSSFKRIVAGYKILDQSLVEGNHREKTCVCARSEGFTATFQYEYQNIIDMVQHPLELNVGYTTTTNRRVSDVYELHISLELEALVARVSIKSVPVLIKIARKFNELIQKKRAEAGLHDNKQRGQPQSTQHHVLSELQSQLVVSMKAIEIVIYPSQFDDSDNIHLRARALECCLEAFPRDLAAGIHRKLQVTITSAALAKNVSGVDIMSMGPTLKTSSGTPIFGIPETSLVMESTELSQHVRYTFDALFAGRISVSLNLGLIKYLQEMVAMFNVQFDRALGASSSSSSSGYQGEQWSASSGDELYRSLRGGGSSNASGRVYTPIHAVNFKPQLQVMGDATPPVEWLGLKREAIPGQVHEKITLQLDKAIRAMWDVLEAQTD